MARTVADIAQHKLALRVVDTGYGADSWVTASQADDQVIKLPVSRSELSLELEDSPQSHALRGESWISLRRAIRIWLSGWPVRRRGSSLRLRILASNHPGEQRA